MCIGNTATHHMCTVYASFDGNTGARLCAHVHLWFVSFAKPNTHRIAGCLCSPGRRAPIGHKRRLISTEFAGFARLSCLDCQRKAQLLLSWCSGHRISSFDSFALKACGGQSLILHCFSSISQHFGSPGTSTQLFQFGITSQIVVPSDLFLKLLCSPLVSACLVLSASDCCSWFCCYHQTHLINIFFSRSTIDPQLGWLTESSFVSVVVLTNKMVKLSIHNPFGCGEQNRRVDVDFGRREIVFESEWMRVCVKR